MSSCSLLAIQKQNAEILNILVDAHPNPVSLTKPDSEYLQLAQKIPDEHVRRDILAALYRSSPPPADIMTEGRSFCNVYWLELVS